MIIFFLLCMISLVAIIIIYIRMSNYYPQLKVYIDITNKRNLNDADLCLDFHFKSYGYQEITEHLNIIQEWKQDKLISCKDNPSKILALQKRWERNCHKAFRFIVFRTQTKYRQVNYVRSAYKSNVTYFDFCLTDIETAQRINYQIQNLETNI